MKESSSKPAVVVVMPLADLRGGAELALLQLVGNETSMKWHTVFLEDGPMVEEFRRLGYSAEVIEAGRVRHPLKMLSTVWAISRLAKRFNAQVMLGWMAKAHLYSGSAALLGGLPAVWFQHGLPTKGSWIDGLANRIPAVGAMACSQFSVDSQLRVTPLLPMKAVYAPTDLRRFNPAKLPSPAACRAELKLPAEGPIIGIFGRLQKWKGMHVLIDALPAVLAKYPNATALVVGGIWDLEADYEKQLHERSRSLGIEGHVVFAGHQTDIPRWTQACDVVVHASDHEPFGMVVVEAMALGKPTIAGASGGPLEIITNGVNGLLVGYEDVPGMSAAILQYLADPVKAQQMAELGRQKAQNFSLDRFVQNVSQTLKNWIYSPSPTDPKPVHAS